MTPIIDPMMFYWAEVSHIAKMVCVFVGLFMVFGSVISWSETIQYDTQRLLSVILTALTVLLIAGAVFFPTSKTMYKMAITKNITADNITIVKGELTDLVDYIVDKIDEVKE